MREEWKPYKINSVNSFVDVCAEYRKVTDGNGNEDTVCVNQETQFALKATGTLKKYYRVEVPEMYAKSQAKKAKQEQWLLGAMGGAVGGLFSCIMGASGAILKGSSVGIVASVAGGLAWAYFMGNRAESRAYDKAMQRAEVAPDLPAESWISVRTITIPSGWNPDLTYVKQ
ncbi:hypothetical protein ACFL6Y_11230 [Elusimicrobiota bacterium]